MEEEGGFLVQRSFAGYWCTSQVSLGEGHEQPTSCCWAWSNSCYSSLGAISLVSVSPSDDSPKKSSGFFDAVVLTGFD